MAAGGRWNRRRIFEIVEEAAPGDRVSAAFDTALIILIVLNVAAVILETVPSIEAEWGDALVRFEIASVVVFTIEYGLRIWVAPEHPAHRRLSAAASRGRYLISPGALIDLAAILPFYLAWLFGADLRILRILRLLRFFKLIRYSPALLTMQRVVIEERRALMGALLIMLCLLIIASTAMYYAERHAQPEMFGSIPAAMWWALATLTTVGYGDMVPVTLIGKVIGGVVMLLGLGMFALPIGILATGFTQEVRRREFVVTGSMVGRLPLFENLPAPEIVRLTRQMRAIRYETGTVMVRRGEPVEALHFLAVGTAVSILAGSEKTLEEGDIFGETAFLHGIEDDLTVIASEQCLVMALDLRDVSALAAREPGFGAALKEMAEARIRLMDVE